MEDWLVRSDYGSVRDDHLVRGSEDLSFLIDPSQVDNNSHHLADLNISGKVTYIFDFVQPEKACYIWLRHAIHSRLADL